MEMRPLKTSGHACRILARLVKGQSITNAQATRLFDCYSLSSRICELKRRGWAIRSTPLVLRSKKRIAVYSLAS
jgi:hypothetical protein